MKENAHLFPVEKMCKVLNVTGPPGGSSGYYYWRKHPVGVRQQNQNQLVNHIRRVHKQSESRYGSPRIADELREQGIKVSRNRVARLMKKAGIRSILHKKYHVQTTESDHDHPVAKNVLNREFTADKPGQKWVSDITARRPGYIATGQGWLYLTVILDLADRKVVGWAMSETLKAVDTTVAAWRMALKNRAIDNHLIFHCAGSPVGSGCPICLYRI